MEDVLTRNDSAGLATGKLAKQAELSCVKTVSFEHVSFIALHGTGVGTEALTCPVKRSSNRDKTPSKKPSCARCSWLAMGAAICRGAHASCSRWRSRSAPGVKLVPLVKALKVETITARLYAHTATQEAGIRAFVQSPDFGRGNRRWRCEHDRAACGNAKGVSSQRSQKTLKRAVFWPFYTLLREPQHRAQLLARYPCTR